jgi:V/A-type H+-transporting ATPase subunit C
MLLLDERRLTRDALRYGFAVGKLRVLETRMLDRSAGERLVDAPTFAEQKRLLSDTAFGRYLESAQTASDVERGLDEALDDFYRFIGDAALPQSVADFFRTRYDYANLKAALKARMLSAPLEGLLQAHGSVAAASFEGDPAQLPGALGELTTSLAEETDPAKVDASVDKAMYAELGRLAKASKSAYLTKLARLMVDVGNVKTLVRGMHAGMTEETITGLLSEGGTVEAKTIAALAHGTTGDLGPALKRMGPLSHFSAVDLSDPLVIDVAADAVIMSVLREGRRGPVGPEPVIAYVFAREVEVATLRMLLLGRLSGIPTETLRARLRAAYR